MARRIPIVVVLLSIVVERDIVERECEIGGSEEVGASERDLGIVSLNIRGSAAAAIEIGNKVM